MNKYEIIGIVGEGAYGIVYKAKNKDSGEYGKSNIFSIFLWTISNFRLFCSCYKKVQRVSWGGSDCEKNNKERS